MNVDRVRTLDPSPSDPAASLRTAKPGQGFDGLMESLLGNPADERSALRDRAEEGPSRSVETRGEPARRDQRALRPDRPDRPERPERGARSARSARGEARATSQEEVDDGADRSVEAEQPAGTAATAATRKSGIARKGEALEDEPSGSEQPQPEATAAASVAAIAVPELIALAVAPITGQADASDAAALTAPSGDAAEGSQGILDALAGATAAGLGDDGGEGLAAGTPTVIPANGALEAGVVGTVIAAIEGRAPGEVDARPGGELGSAAIALAELPADGNGDRREVPRSEAPRREAESPVVRAADTILRAELAVAPARGGSEGSLEDRPRDTPTNLAPPVETERGQAATAAAEAVEATAPTQSSDAAGRPLDVAAQARIEGMSLGQSIRAPEPMSPTQTGRPMPAAAPDAIHVQADWLASRGGGTARLVLHPPELGEIAIRVTVRNQSVDVVMVAHTALAHQVAEDQSDRLTQAFASRDLRLEQFEVRRGDPSDASSTGEFGSSHAGERERERAQAEGERGGASFGASQRGTTASPLAVALPHERSSERAEGIDLRI